MYPPICATKEEAHPRSQLVPLEAWRHSLPDPDVVTAIEVVATVIGVVATVTGVVVATGTEAVVTVIGMVAVIAVQRAQGRLATYQASRLPAAVTATGGAIAAVDTVTGVVIGAAVSVEANGGSGSTAMMTLSRVSRATWPPTVGSLVSPTALGLNFQSTRTSQWR